MPNPQGTNQFDRFAKEPPYGEGVRKEALAQSAPSVNPPSVSSPDTYKARATNPPRRAVSPPKATKAPGGSPPPYEAELALTWAEIAAQPGASDLVKAIAQRAQRFNAP